METFWQDLKYGARQLARSPGFTAVAVLTLALGIGANTALFSVINGVLLKPLPYPQPDRLVVLWSSHPARGVRRFAVDPTDFEAWRTRNTVFEDMGIWSSVAGVVQGGKEPQRIVVMRVSSGYFRTLGTPPLLGRIFVEGEDSSGTSEAAVLSYSFWQSYFGGASDILGKTFRIDRDSLTVVGVMPADFQSVGGEPQLWRPFGDAPNYGGGSGSYTVLCVARLKPGFTMARAQAEMDSLTAATARENPQLKKGVEALVDSLPELVVRDVRTALLILWGIVGLVLLIACANVAGLLLARGAGRGREIAIRLALGASRTRVVRQLLTESVLISLVGGAAGCLLALWGIDVLPALGGDRIPRLNDVGVDRTVLAFAFGLSLLAGILAGLLPAFRSTRGDLQECLKEGGRWMVPARHRLRSLLLVAEFALTIVVLVGAGLLIRSYTQLLKEDPGFNPSHLLTFRLEPLRVAQFREGEPPENYWRRRAAERERMSQFYDELLEGISGLPMVQSAAACNQLPLQGTYWAVLLTIEGRPPVASANEAPAAQSRVVTPGYFRAMQIPLRRGRVFTQLDDAGATRVAVIDETMARMNWPDEDPIGKRITTEDPAHDAWLTIVGVVGDVRPLSLEAPPQPTLYVPFAQSRLGFGRDWRMNMVVRSAGDPLALLPAIRTLVWSRDKTLPLANIATLEEILSETLSARRFHLVLLAVFAGVALLLAAVGIFGMISYVVSQRTREIGIRVAMGAGPGDIRRWVLRHGVGLALIGCVVGVAGALAATRVMSSLLFGVTAADPLTYVGVSLLLAGVALLACWLPARRATRVDPLVALRCE